MVIYEFQSWVSEFIHQPIDSSASKQPKCMTSIVFYLCGYKTCLTEYSAIVLSNSNGPVPGTNWWRRRRNELLVKETRQRGKVRNNDSSITPHFDINPNDTFLQTISMFYNYPRDVSVFVLHLPAASYLCGSMLHPATHPLFSTQKVLDCR